MNKLENVEKYSPWFIARQHGVSFDAAYMRLRVSTGCVESFETECRTRVRIVIAEHCFFGEQFNVAGFANAETSSRRTNQPNLTYRARFCPGDNFFLSASASDFLPALARVCLPFEHPILLTPGIFCNFYQASSPFVSTSPFDAMYFTSDAFKRPGAVLEYFVGHILDVVGWSLVNT